MHDKKVLIIDDDIDLVEAMRITLESAGFEIIDAQNGQQGILKLKRYTPDIIILDVMMNTRDEGFHTAYEIRSIDNFKDIPIIMLTAIAQETGFSDFLPTGKGLFAFETGEDVLSAINELNRDYALHASAARDLAEKYFESGLVLKRLLRGIGAI